jgi:osmotically-inducible protein OsmY
MNGELVGPAAPFRDRAQEILSAVSDALFASRYADLAFVDCEICGNRVVLFGSVPSYRLKQVAQALVMRVVGAGRVDNRLAVRPREEGGGDDDRLP